MRKTNKKIVKTIGVVCFKEDKVLLVKHGEAARQPKGIYGLPSGHVEENEELIEAAKREFNEETGLLAHVLTPLGHEFDPIQLTLKTGTFNFKWHVFICQKYSGELKANDETEPEWVEIEKVRKLWVLPNILKAIKVAKKKK